MVKRLGSEVRGFMFLSRSREAVAGRVEKR